MPDGLAEITLGDGVQQYKELRDIERKLDYAMMRKRLEIGDSIHRLNKRHKTMRIWISNTAENQPWQDREMEADAFDFTTGVDGVYRVKIEGRLLDDDSDEPNVDQSEEEAKADGGPTSESKIAILQGRTRSRLSHFFRTITIEYDRAIAVPAEPPRSNGRSRLAAQNSTLWNSSERVTRIST